MCMCLWLQCRQSSLVVLIYDVTAQESFAAVKGHLEQVRFSHIEQVTRSFFAVTVSPVLESDMQTPPLSKSGQFFFLK